MDNIILTTDSYKASHFLQYPPNTTNVFSYIEAREGGAYGEVLFFGLQMFLKKLEKMRVTMEMIDEAEAIFLAHGEPFNREGWEIIVKEYEGRLPIAIHALPEGMVVPAGTPLVTVTNTDSRLFWLTSYIETALLRAVWYPSTVATISLEIKQTIKDYLEYTSDNVAAVLPFRLHDFGARGVSSGESAEIGGAAHLVNFMGSDTIEGIMAIRKYYDFSGMPAYSIPAAEHSTITSWGKNGEVDAYVNMLDQFAAPGKILAVVSDSYDLFNAVDNIWGGKLKNYVENQGGLVVIRPDSGNPVETPVRVIERLIEKFGSRTNSKGYEVLPDCIRVIQGDGVNHNSITEILQELYVRKISAENIAFGMGGALLQQPNRDTLRFAMKASAVKVDGQWRNIQKRPSTDLTKASKAGRMAVVMREGNPVVVPLEGHAWENIMQPVFVNGFIRKTYSFEEIRNRAASALV